MYSFGMYLNSYDLDYVLKLRPYRANNYSPCVLKNGKMVFLGKLLPRLMNDMLSDHKRLYTNELIVFCANLQKQSYKNNNNEKALTLNCRRQVPNLLEVPYFALYLFLNKLCHS